MTLTSEGIGASQSAACPAAIGRPACFVDPRKINEAPPPPFDANVIGEPLVPPNPTGLVARYGALGAPDPKGAPRDMDPAKIARHPSLILSGSTSALMSQYCGREMRANERTNKHKGI